MIDKQTAPQPENGTDAAGRLENIVGRCRKCGREKITACQAVAGMPGYHVQGTRVEYCGVCDTPPIMTLDTTLTGAVMVQD
jgi:hypothetical protein